VAIEITEDIMCW